MSLSYLADEFGYPISPFVLSPSLPSIHPNRTLLSESFGALSDDKTTKDEILSDVIRFGAAEYKTPKTSPVRDLLNFYFTGLMLEKE